jgi:hypothetical protein
MPILGFGIIFLTITELKKMKYEKNHQRNVAGSRNIYKHKIGSHANKS